MARRIEGDKRRDNLRQRRLLDALERAFQSRLAREIARSMRARVADLGATGEVAADLEHRANIERLYEAMALSSIRRFGQRFQAAAKGRNLDRKDFSDTFAKQALAFVMQEGVRRRITAVSDNTRGQIIAAVENGQEAGLGVDVIARNIRDTVPGISRLRGALIARTETHGAANYGADVAARETGLILRKEWVAAQDERTRQDHVEADGQIVEMGSAFLVGGESLMFPGDPAGSVAQVINCRCSVSHIVVDE